MLNPLAASPGAGERRSSAFEFTPQQIEGVKVEEHVTWKALSILKERLTNVGATSRKHADQLVQLRITQTVFTTIWSMVSGVALSAWGAVALIAKDNLDFGPLLGIVLLCAGFLHIVALLAALTYGRLTKTPLLFLICNITVVIALWLSGASSLWANHFVRVSLVGFGAVALSEGKKSFIWASAACYFLLFCLICVLQIAGYPNDSKFNYSDFQPWQIHMTTFFFGVSCEGVMFCFLGILLNRIDQIQEETVKEQQLSLRLLHNTLPGSVANQLLRKLRKTPDTDMKNLHLAFPHPMATVMFCDVCGFTALSSQMEPVDLVRSLNLIIQDIDLAAQKHQVEKIKTIGDAYMAVAIPAAAESAHHKSAAASVLNLSICVHEIIKGHKLGPKPLECRVGVHSGPLVSGVIGLSKFQFDVFGDTVNVASRMESTGINGTTQVSSQTVVLSTPLFKYEYRGKIEMKGKGEVETHLLLTTKVQIKTRSSLPVQKTTKLDSATNTLETSKPTLCPPHIGTSTEIVEEVPGEGSKVDYTYVPWLQQNDPGEGGSEDWTEHQGKTVAPSASRMNLITQLDKMTMEDDVEKLNREVKNNHIPSTASMSLIGSPVPQPISVSDSILKTRSEERDFPFSSSADPTILQTVHISPGEASPVLNPSPRNPAECRSPSLATEWLKELPTVPTAPVPRPIAQTPTRDPEAGLANPLESGLLPRNQTNSGIAFG